MRTVAILITVVATACSPRNPKTISRLDLPLDQRIELPQRVDSSSLSLAEFVQFIATSFKVPLLVETPSPVPDLRIDAGTYSARALLDLAINQVRGFKWEDEAGVAHIYEQHLMRSSGNLLNVRIPQFAFPATVGEFMYFFRPCIYSVIQGYNCMGGAYTGFQLPQLKQGALPFGQNFKDATARDILLSALKTNGRFYVLVAFEGTEPKLNNEYPVRNWFAESLEVSEPTHLPIEIPKAHATAFGWTQTYRLLRERVPKTTPEKTNKYEMRRTGKILIIRADGIEILGMTPVGQTIPLAKRFGENAQRSLALWLGCRSSRRRSKGKQRQNTH